MEPIDCSKWLCSDLYFPFISTCFIVTYTFPLLATDSMSKIHSSSTKWTKWTAFSIYHKLFWLFLSLALIFFQNMRNYQIFPNPFYFYFVEVCAWHCLLGLPSWSGLISNFHLSAVFFIESARLLRPVASRAWAGCKILTHRHTCAHAHNTHARMHAHMHC